MPSPLEALEQARATNPGISMFAGPKGLSEEQQLERLSALLGEQPPKQESAPAVAAPVATEQPQAVETAPVVATPEVTTPDTVEPARMAVPAVDLEALQRDLVADGVEEETAKRLATGTIGRLAQASAAAAAETQQARRDRFVSKYGAVYPELKKPGVMDMLVQGTTGDADIQKRMLMLFGDRKQVMRDQVEQQFTAPNRQVAKDAPKTDDEIAFAAFAEYVNSGGDMNKAMGLKQQLKSQR